MEHFYFSSTGSLGIFVVDLSDFVFCLFQRKRFLNHHKYKALKQLEMNDSYMHQGLRKKLVEEIRQKGIADENVLAAIGKVPRHLFMESSFINFAYKDQAFPIGAGQTISQPYTVAFQSELLQVNKGDKILEIGTGSGYQTAILLELGARVYTIERQRELFTKAQAMLPGLGYHPHFFYGDGYEGKLTYGPYDKIIVTAGAATVPEKLLGQINENGIIVIPVGGSQLQKMITITKVEGEFITKEHGNFVFVPLLKGKQ